MGFLGRAIFISFAIHDTATPGRLADDAVAGARMSFMMSRHAAARIQT
jgi:hypothetical protein